MTLSRSALGSLVDTGNLQAYTTGSATSGTASGAATGAANQRIFAYVIVSDSNDADPSAITVVNSPWGVSSWTTLHDDIIVIGTNRYRFALLTGVTGGSAPGSDTFDISVAAGTGNQTGAAIYVEGWVDDSGSVPELIQSLDAQPASAGTTPSATLAALTGTNPHVSTGFFIQRNPPGITPDTGWLESFDLGYGSPAAGLAVLRSDGITSDNTPSGTWSSGTLQAWIGYEVGEPAVSDRNADVSFAEMEVADAPREADVSFAEMEVPDAPRGADVSFAEMEVPTAPRVADVSFAEMELPDAPRSTDVSFAEMEVPDAPRAVDVSFAEMEVADAPRSVDVSFAEMEVPEFARSVDVSFAEMEVADAPRSVDVSFAEMQVADAPRSVDVSFSEMEVPTAPRGADVSFAELEVPDSPGRHAQVSFAEMEVPDAPRAAIVSLAEMRVPSLYDGKDGWEVRGGDMGISGKNRRRKERPRGLGRHL